MILQVNKMLSSFGKSSDGFGRIKREPQDLLLLGCYGQADTTERPGLSLKQLALLWA